MRNANSPVLARLLALAALGCPAAGWAAEPASVSGRVLNAATGAPLHAALVSLATLAERPLEATTYTDSNGRFGFENVPPGRYMMSASEDGYAQAWFGAATPDRVPAVLTLRSGEVRQDILFQLTALSSVSGVLLDQEGDPLLHGSVQLLAERYDRGKPVWTVYYNSGVNDRGEFRLQGVRPGRYILLAASDRNNIIETRPEVVLGESLPQQVYARLYYPAATRVRDAQRLEVRPGSRISGLDFRLTPVAVATVQGTVDLPEGAPRQGVVVHLAPVGEGEVSWAGRGSTFTRDGKFTFGNVPPGRYQIIGMLASDQSYRGAEYVDLAPGPQELRLRLSKGVRVAGKVEVRGRATEVKPFQVSLIPDDPNSPGRGALRTRTQPDGSFAFDAVTAGVWDIGIGPLPTGGFIQAMTLGAQDVLTEDMFIGASPPPALHIVVNTQGGVLSGVVKRPDAGAGERSRPIVMLAPSGRFSHVLSFFHLVPADETGKYEIRGITPGSYKLYAFEQMAQGAWRQPEFLQRVDPLGKPLEVREGEQLEQDVEALPFDPGGPR